MTYRLRWLWWVAGLSLLSILISTATRAEVYPFGCSWSYDYEHYRTPPYSIRLDGAGGVYSSSAIGPLWVFDCRAGGWRVEEIGETEWWNPCLHTVWIDDYVVPEPAGILTISILTIFVASRKWSWQS